MQVSNIFLVCFSSVEEAGHVVSYTAVLLGSKNLRHEFLNAWSILLFVDHVEPSNKIGVLLFGNANVV